jgi:phage terminase Nu1 subunit (DNA packaging protein)
MSRREELVKVSRLAELFSCSERHVQLMASRDGMPKAKHGLYHLDACVKWRIAWLESQMAEKSKQAEELSLDKEQTRKCKAEADLKEMDLRERKGELIPIAVYRELMASKITTARQNLLNLPARIAHELVGLELPVLKAKLRGGVHAALTALAVPEGEDDEQHADAAGSAG